MRLPVMGRHVLIDLCFCMGINQLSVNQLRHNFFELHFIPSVQTSVRPILAAQSSTRMHVLCLDSCRVSAGSRRPSKISQQATGLAAYYRRNNIV